MESVLAGGLTPNASVQAFLTSSQASPSTGVAWGELGAGLELGPEPEPGLGLGLGPGFGSSSVVDASGLRLVGGVGVFGDQDHVVPWGPRPPPGRWAGEVEAAAADHVGCPSVFMGDHEGEGSKRGAFLPWWIEGCAGLHIWYPHWVPRPPAVGSAAERNDPDNVRLRNPGNAREFTLTRTRPENDRHNYQHHARRTEGLGPVDEGKGGHADGIKMVPAAYELRAGPLVGPHGRFVIAEDDTDDPPWYDHTKHPNQGRAFPVTTMAQALGEDRTPLLHAGHTPGDLAVDTERFLVGVSWRGAAALAVTPSQGDPVVVVRPTQAGGPDRLLAPATAVASSTPTLPFHLRVLIRQGRIAEAEALVKRATLVVAVEGEGDGGGGRRGIARRTSREWSASRRVVAAPVAAPNPARGRIHRALERTMAWALADWVPVLPIYLPRGAITGSYLGDRDHRHRHRHRHRLDAEDRVVPEREQEEAAKAMGRRGHENDDEKSSFSSRVLPRQGSFALRPSTVSPAGIDGSAVSYRNPHFHPHPQPQPHDHDFARPAIPLLALHRIRPYPDSDRPSLTGEGGSSSTGRHDRGDDGKEQKALYPNHNHDVRDQKPPPVLHKSLDALPPLSIHHHVVHVQEQSASTSSSSSFSLSSPTSPSSVTSPTPSSHVCILSH